MNFENKKSLLLLGFEHTITKFCDETLNQLRYPASYFITILLYARSLALSLSRVCVRAMRIDESGPNIRTIAYVTKRRRKAE